MLPFVTCICPTMSLRLEWLPKAIESFMAQDYLGGAEMLIVADENIIPTALAECVVSGMLRPCHPQREGSQVKIGISNGVLGEKRNTACRNARGEIIAHFDDDDISAPGRLTDQVMRLLEPGCAVTGYNTMVVRELRQTRVMQEDGTWRPGAEWWKFTSRDGACAGASLCYHRDWWRTHRFPEVACGEDDPFYAAAVADNTAIAADGSDFFRVTNHAGNVSGRLIGGAEWQELSGDPWND